MHTIVQRYLQSLYSQFDKEINESIFSVHNEIYGELYYYSALKLFKHLHITEHDHFLDLGCGLGKLLFQVMLTTDAQHVSGIEINPSRYQILSNVLSIMKMQLPDLFIEKNINIIQGDFLHYNFHSISIVYICNTVFSLSLIEAISIKINTMHSVVKVVSFRKLPLLTKFKLTKKIFLHTSWDLAVCYLYVRNESPKSPETKGDTL